MNTKRLSGLMQLAVAAGLILPLPGLLAQQGKKSDIYHKGWIDFNKNGKKDIYEDPLAPVDKRVEDLLSQMSLNEKSCQMATLYGYRRVLKDSQPTPEWQHEIWKDGIANIDENLNNVPNHTGKHTSFGYPHSTHAVSMNNVQRWFVEDTRLGIPVDFTNEAIHGLCSDGATPFPAPISIGSTWDKQLVHMAGDIVGREAKALGYTNVYAPILDPSRDPRWGRVVETYGESPYLIASLGTEMVKGIQQNGVASTLKHFAVYSVPKGGRDGEVRTDPHVAPKEMHEIFLYPFRKVIQQAHPMGVMSSYNDWDGEPITGSHYFLTTLLRGEFGFKGYVVSDSKAVEFLYEKHHVAHDFEDATREAVEAGLNVWTNFNQPKYYINNVRNLVKAGKLDIGIVNDRVRDVLRVKFELGLFDQPYVADPKAADQIVQNRQADSVALALNQEAIVLLKNQGDLLPIQPGQYKKILITGELASNGSYATSRYGPNNNKVTTVLEGIRTFIEKNKWNTQISYDEGAKVLSPSWPKSEILPTDLSQDEKASIEKAVQAAKSADVIIAVVGENGKTVGESLSRTSLGLPGKQLDLLKALKATGKPVILVLVTGQPLTINWAEAHIPAIMTAGFPGPQGGTAIAQAIFGQYNPGGRLSMTWPKAVGQVQFNFPFKNGSQLDQGGPHKKDGFGHTRVNGPLYPFGYGLSYTKFTYSDLKITPDEKHTKGTIHVTCKIANSGKVAGDEVVQLYVKDVYSSVTTYNSVLRGFERVHLAPGAAKTVSFDLVPDDLALTNRDMHRVVEPGDFEIRVGASSEDIRLKQTITVAP
ncbi:glycoside hydrolase family 3 N-terminal domain-containing protein [Arachidicoccus terrestris]|uniref:glycoside hydrolase family 3 N-terminal domain-containing protein n=1 Tax=Arachidicoccus terrestris TaxID=2875539 RepID=UPI001CC491E1|nr:glycoside hydrolase family 3 N-terminal domain-containing protein [Arachidicoccus terrestris]